MAWRQPGDKPLSEAMMVRLPKHICITQPQWSPWTQTWWQYDMETLSALLALCVTLATSLFPSQGAYNAGGVDAFLAVSLNSLNKLLNTLSRGWWLEIPWRLCDVIVMRIALSVLVLAQLILSQLPVLHFIHVMKYCNYSQNYLIISWYLHVRNGVAVAAYSRLASRSQAKFHTLKLSPLIRPCAAAPAQSTTSAYRSLDFRRATSSQRGRWVGSWPLLLRSVHEDTS